MDSGPPAYHVLLPTGPIGSNGSIFINTLGVPVVANTWVHLAMTRSGDTYRFFLNGQAMGSTVTAYRRPAGLKRVYIGNSTRGFVDALDGMVDEILIARECLYTESFTPPAQPYTSAWPAAANAWPAGVPFK